MAKTGTAATPQRTGIVEIRAAINGYVVFPNKGVPGQHNPPEFYYVFPDFASLSAWLKKNLTHGGGVQA